MLEGVAATVAARETRGAAAFPAIGLFAVGAFDIAAGIALSLDAVARFTGRKPLLPIFNRLFNWG